MIKLFVNVKEEIVEIYIQNEVKKINFDDIYLIGNIIEDQRVHYITGVKENDTKEVIKLVCSLQGKEIKEIKKYNSLDEIGGDRVFLRNITKGTIFVPDINFTLRGKFDIIEITDEIKNKIQDSKLLKDLISGGKVKIIGEVERKIFFKELKKEREKEQKRSSLRDSSLDSIVVERGSDGDFETSTKGDIIPVDIMARGTDENGISTMSENMANFEE